MRVLMLATSYAGRRGPMDAEADALRREGHEVDVVRIGVRPSAPGQGPLGRLPGLAGNWLAAVRASVTGRRVDRIMVDTSPPLAFAPPALRARLTGEEITLLHYDVFPENLAAFGVRLPGPALRLLGAATHRLARLADAHRTLSPAMAATLSSALGDDVRIDVTPLAPPPGLVPVARGENRWLRDRGLEDRFVVMYAGNLGRAYDFGPVLDAARELEGPNPPPPFPTREGGATVEIRSAVPLPVSGRGQGLGFGRALEGAGSRIVFVFVGSGQQEDRIREAAERLRNVLLFPPEDDARLSELLSAGDLHVVPLRPGADRVMWPHKVDAIREIGRPVLAVGWGEGVEGVEVVEAGALAEEIGKRAGSAT